MLHEPAEPGAPDAATSYKSRLGVVMFVVYGIVYMGFVAINVLSPAFMEKIVLFGLNLAVVYGLGLIVFALLLALVYNRLCSLRESSAAREREEGSGE